MSILIASNLAKSYGAHDLFSGVSLEIPRAAKIALVGPNGAGKTTLLRLLAGLEPPSHGTVQSARGLRIGYMPQQADLAGDGSLWEAMDAVFAPLHQQAAELRRLEAAMSEPATRAEALERYGRAMEAFELAGGYTYEQRIRYVLFGLGFDVQEFQQPIAQLSGGQKTRARLARLLLESPDLLLLDEPTNHLDLAGVEWLEDYLKEWRGAVVIVAHDRAFLDAVVDQVWEMAWGKLERYRGNYSAYVTQKAGRVALQQAAYERQQALIAQTEEFIRRNISGQRTREAQGRQKRLERVERIASPREYRPMGLTLGQRVARSGDLVVGLYDLDVGYRLSAPLFTVEEVELRRGQRVALIGPNGSGKTTLARTIVGQLRPLAGRVRIGANVKPGYFAQGHADLDPRKTVLDTILDAGDMLTGEARTYLGRYRFSGDDVFKLVGSLSGGEQARVALALLALQGANFLILDEPTNHLDIPSQEILQEVLADFGGTLLMVSHDRYLIRNLATCIWAIDDGRLRVFPEGYAEYHAWEAQRRQAKRTRDDADAAPKSERMREREARKAAEREAARQIRRRIELEERIQRLEARRAELEDELALASAQQAVERVSRLGVEYTALQEELDALLIAWVEET